MLLFYVRHGDPVYHPDSLTPLGKRQAESVAKRLALFGIDEIYASTSNRAIETAQPTCELLKKEMKILEFCNEKYAFQEFSVPTKEGRRWVFDSADSFRAFTDRNVRQLGDNWYEHPDVKDYKFKAGVERISCEADRFLLSLGYEHIRRTGRYKVIRTNNERVALFAHQGFGLAFLSCLLDIPYPDFCMHFDLCHSSMTVIEFMEQEGYSIPRVLTLSSDSHLYKDGLPLNYNQRIRF